MAEEYGARRKSFLLPESEASVSEAPAAGDDSAPLPPGWQRLQDKGSKRYYYYHTETREVQWSRPAADEAAGAAAEEAPPPPPPEEEKAAAAAAAGDDAADDPCWPSERDDSAESLTLSGKARRAPDQTLLNQRLRTAVDLGDMGEILELARAGASLDSADGSDKGYAPLHQAVFFDQTRSVRALLQAGANANVLLPKSQGGYAPLHLAVQLGRPEAARELLEGGAAVDCRANGPKQAGYTPLLVAVMYGEADIARLLLDGGANPLVKPHGANSKCPLDYALSAADKTGDRTLVQLLKGYEREAIRGMQRDERTAYTGTMGNTLRRGIAADLPTDQDMACFEAARAGRLDEVEVYVARGADVRRAQGGTTPLHQAAFHGHVEVALALLRAGAAAADRDRDGKTALQVASENGRLGAARVLRHWEAAGEYNGDEIVKEGPLDKKGGFRTMVWQSRHFVLGPRAVFYYKSEADRAAGVPAGGFRADAVAFVAPSAPGSAEFTVRAKPRGEDKMRLFELRAAVPAAAREWIARLVETRDRAKDAIDAADG